MSDVLFNNGKFSVVSINGDVIVTKYGNMIDAIESKRTNLTVSQAKFLIKQYGEFGVARMWRANQ